ncbi:MAG: sigma-70 family RNA polymerase sigma factor [Flavobacteriaceae bacterium]|nr:sigma-70 family RNA polymerase sigma factor [Flavobacteriaceae bacterium]
MKKQSRTKDQQYKLNEIRSNNQRVLQVIYAENFEKVRRYILNNSGTEDMAKDVYQEAFLAFWQNIQQNKFHFQPNHTLEGYLFQIAKYKWLDNLRQNRNQPIQSLPDEYSLHVKDEKDEKEKKWAEVNHQLNLALEELGDECKETLLQFYFYRNSLKKIAEYFGITENSAKNKKYRCIQKLKEIMVKQ